MKTYKQSLKLLKYNFSSVILFEIIFKLLSAAILVPLLYGVLNYSIYAAGIDYLSVENMNQYFKSPTTYCVIFLILLMISGYLLINASGLIYAMESSHREEKTNAIVILLKGFGNALRVLNPKNLGIIIYLLFVLPFSYTVMISGSLVGIKIPEAFKIFIEQHQFFFDCLVAMYFVLCFVSMLWIFTLNYFTLHKVDFKLARQKSKTIIKHHMLKIIFGVVFYNAVITFVLFLLEGTLATAIASILEKVVSYKRFQFLFVTLVQGMFLILYIIFSVISTPLIYSYICTCFYQLEGDDGYKEYEEIKKKRRFKARKELTIQEKKKRERIAFAVVFFLGLALNLTYIYLSLSNKMALNIMYPSRATVTAHRGDSYNAPENTMAAIELAVENQADIIEIDVRQTKDGQLILMHDESLYRTTDVTKKVGEVDYEFIKTLDAGSKFSEDYAGEPIPLLEDVLIYGKEHDIFYNIELKPSDTDVEYEERIVELIENYDYVDDCVVASSNYESLRRVKLINEDIKTVYIMSVVFGHFETMEYVDAFSIKYRYITKDMVRNIHKEGKEIYAWTVNTEGVIKNMLLLDVDSIITDKPYDTKEIIYNANDTAIIDWLQRLVDEY